MEEQNFDIVAAVKQLVEDYGHLANEIAEVKQTIYDNLINPIQAEFEQMQHDEALSDFRCKHAERLEPFNDKLKALEHDENFDIVEKAFDDFSAREDGMEEDEYVEKLAEKVQSQLDEIAGIFGVAPEAVEEIKVETEEGEIKAEVEDGEVVAVENETTEEDHGEIEGNDATESEPEIPGEEVATEEELTSTDTEEPVEENTEETTEEIEEPEEVTMARKIHKMLGIEE